jgi:hypothetical protein
MDAADDLELRWIHLDPAHAGAGPGSLSHTPGLSGSAAPTPGTRLGASAAGPSVSSHDLSNAVTAIVGAARLLCERWEELDDAQRRELAHMVLRRAEELRQALERTTTG